MGPFFTALKTIADWVVGPHPDDVTRQAPAKRSYAGAAYDRVTSDWVSVTTSADTEIITGLRQLRARSRELVRNNDYAKNALRLIVNNVIGGGIGMQGHVTGLNGKLRGPVNDAIESAWEAWACAETCDVSGRLSLADMERLVMQSLAESGEVMIRIWRRPFGSGTIPIGLQIIESDQLVDQIQTAQAPNGNRIRMGVEEDEFHRPLAYWLYPNHPGDYQFNTFVPSQFIRVPAEDVIHLYVMERPGQTRGVPWFHTAMRRLNNMGGYEEAEIISARSAACIMGFVTSPEAPQPEDTINNQRVLSMEPGTIEHLLPGEDYTLSNPTRPNANMDPFMRLMLRGVAAGVGVSYESLSRDYSQSNYSSSRLALLDDRDNWRALQMWFIRNFRARLHNEWMDAAVLSGALKFADYYGNKTKYQAVRFRPRGWSWVDPAKEVGAFKEAVRAGFTTVTDVIAQSGGGMDIEDVVKTRADELAMFADAGIVTDTDPANDQLPALATPDAETPTDDAGEMPSDETSESNDNANT